MNCRFENTVPTAPIVYYLYLKTAAKPQDHYLIETQMSLSETAPILEVAMLDVKPGQEKAFENAFKQAQDIISGMQGYISHELQKCVENPSRYLLLVKWETLADHTTGFRESKEYTQWRALLHHFYEPFPDVQHFNAINLS